MQRLDGRLEQLAPARHAAQKALFTAEAPEPGSILPLPPPEPKLEPLNGAPPLRSRRRGDADTQKGFDLAVKLIRRLMTRIEKLEQNLDVQEEPESDEIEAPDPSATGLWRQAPPVRR